MCPENQELTRCFQPDVLSSVYPASDDQLLRNKHKYQHLECSLHPRKYSSRTYLHFKEACDHNDPLFSCFAVLAHAGTTEPNDRGAHEATFIIPQLNAGCRTFSKCLLQEVVLGLQLDNEVAAVQVLLVLLRESGETTVKKNKKTHKNQGRDKESSF